MIIPSHSVFEPDRQQRFQADLVQCYQKLVDHWQPDLRGECVTRFTDKATVHSYLPFYAEQFEPHRSYARLLEIGVMSGASLALWREFFYTSELTGIDQRTTWSEPGGWQAWLESDPAVELIWQVDSTRQQVEFDRPFHFVIDDGDHDWRSQVLTFRNYWPFVKSQGRYYIEDVQDQTSAQALIETLVKWLPTNSAKIYHYRAHRADRQDDQIVWVEKL
jgi:hypothetical protein